MGVQTVSYSPGELERYQKEAAARRRCERIREVRQREDAAAKVARGACAEQRRREEELRLADDLRARLDAEQARLAALLDRRRACEEARGASARAAEVYLSAQQEALERRRVAEPLQRQLEQQRATEALQLSREQRNVELQELSERQAALSKLRAAEDLRAQGAAERGREVAAAREDAQRQAERDACELAALGPKRVLSGDKRGWFDYSKTYFHVTNHKADACEGDAGRQDTIEAEFCRPLVPQPMPTPEQEEQAKVRGQVAEIALSMRQVDTMLQDVLAEKAQHARQEKVQHVLATAASKAKASCAQALLVSAAGSGGEASIGRGARGRSVSPGMSAARLSMVRSASPVGLGGGRRQVVLPSVPLHQGGGDLRDSEDFEDRPCTCHGGGSTAHQPEFQDLSDWSSLGPAAAQFRISLHNLCVPSATTTAGHEVDAPALPAWRPNLAPMRIDAHVGSDQQISAVAREIETLQRTSTELRRVGEQKSADSATPEAALRRSISGAAAEVETRQHGVATAESQAQQNASPAPQQSGATPLMQSARQHVALGAMQGSPDRSGRHGEPMEEWCNLGHGWSVAARAGRGGGDFIALRASLTADGMPLPKFRSPRSVNSPLSQGALGSGRLEELLADTEALLRATADTAATLAWAATGASFAASGLAQVAAAPFPMPPPSPPPPPPPPGRVPSAGAASTAAAAVPPSAVAAASAPRPGGSWARATVSTGTSPDGSTSQGANPRRAPGAEVGTGPAAARASGRGLADSRLASDVLGAQLDLICRGLGSA